MLKHKPIETQTYSSFEHLKHNVALEEDQILFSLPSSLSVPVPTSFAFGACHTAPVFVLSYSMITNLLLDYVLV